MCQLVWKKLHPEMILERLFKTSFQKTLIFTLQTPQPSKTTTKTEQLIQCLFPGQRIHCCMVLWHQGSRIPCGKVGAATPLHSSAAGNVPSEHIGCTPMESFTIRFCQINLVRSFRQRSSNNSECFPCGSAKARRTAALVFNWQQS